MTRKWDVIIVGAGPSGLTLACLLKGRGHSVAVIERTVFPRHQIGESLLPQTMKIFSEIGFTDVIEEGGFMKKMGATFQSEMTGAVGHFPFNLALDPSQPQAYQVSRDRFDKLFIDHTKGMEVDILQPVAATEIDLNENRVIINGEMECSLVVWANGAGNRQLMPENYIQNEPEDQVTAIYSYYDADFSKQEQLGNIIVNLFYEENEVQPQWAWAIPLAENYASVGFVVNSSKLKEKILAYNSLDKIGGRLLGKNSYLHQFIKTNQRRAPYLLRHNFQRVAKRMVWDRQMLVGDAAGFIDPVFSSGIHLGATSALMAVDPIEQALRSKDFSRQTLMPYEQNYQIAFWTYYKIAKAFYQKNIVEKLFLAAPDGTPEALLMQKQFTSILAGDLSKTNPLIDIFSKARLEINPGVSELFCR